MTAAARALVVVLVIAGLAGCSALDPYSTYAEPAPAGAAPRVAICYDTLVSNLDEVRAAAQAQCPTETIAAPHATDYALQYCPLLLPARATFVCEPKK